MSTASRTMKVCIIGGGPLGVGLGRELNEGGIDYDLYESESDFGGVWNGEGACGRVYPRCISSLRNSTPRFPISRCWTTIRSIRTIG